MERYYQHLVNKQYAQRRPFDLRLDTLSRGKKHNTETLVDNLTLHSILLTQIMLETLNGISVPKAPQGNTFTYHANAKEMMMWELGAKNAKHIKSLEEQTGVNLDHYHKLGIMNM